MLIKIGMRYETVKEDWLTESIFGIYVQVTRTKFECIAV